MLIPHLELAKARLNDTTQILGLRTNVGVQFRSQRERTPELGDSTKTAVDIMVATVTLGSWTP